MVVKYICNATWKTCKIPISILNSNYVFFKYPIHKCILSLCSVKVETICSNYILLFIPVCVGRYIEEANTSKCRIIGNFCSQTYGSEVRVA